MVESDLHSDNLQQPGKACIRSAIAQTADPKDTLDVTRTTRSTCGRISSKGSFVALTPRALCSRCYHIHQPAPVLVAAEPGKERIHGFLATNVTMLQAWEGNRTMERRVSCRPRQDPLPKPFAIYGVAQSARVRAVRLHVHCHGRRSQPPAKRIRRRHSGFCLLTHSYRSAIIGSTFVARLAGI